ncbi:unnamed protein product [Effrenium voratum]|uniref:EF-hand domain-containing protein n=1 Tax=Effrenium voratum TaxID=2562239 RepID=A0AA36HML6_9DINO|nr:unnamed protein product [Effrenium voratum]CAJ1452314.1 unnamed protein product [Effrenium voratum]
MSLLRSCSRTSLTSEAVSFALQDVLQNIQGLQKDQTLQLLALDRLAKQVSTLTSNAAVPEPEKAEEPAEPSETSETSEPRLPEDTGEEGKPGYVRQVSRNTTRVIRDEFRDFLKEHRNLAQLFESDEDADHPWYRQLGQAVVEHRVFEKGIGVVILVNSVMLGIETELAIQNQPSAWPADLEYIFMSIYTTELILRLMAYGLAKCCVDGWFIFDSLLVFVAYAGKLLPLILGAAGEGGVVDQIMVVRMLRILRFVRALRVIKQFGTIWKLIRGLLTSFDVMASAFVLVILMLYIFACLGMELIGGDEELKNNPATQLFATESFSSVWQSIMTLFQFVTLDSTPAIYVPLINAKPILGAYFLVLLLAVGITLMNLVTASIVEASLQSSELDRQEKKERLKQEMVKSIPILMKLFHELDVDKSGKISLDEVEHFDINCLPPVLRDNISVDNMADLFGVLDVESAGELDMKEFIGGLLQLWLMDVPITTLQILKFSRMNRAKTMDFFTTIMQRIGEIAGQVEVLSQDLSKTQLHDTRF